MNLNKRFRRNIRNNLSFYLSASLLTAISVFLLICLYSGVAMIDKGFSEVMKIGNVEDAQFTTILPIEDAGIQSLEDKYNVDLEKIDYVDIKESDRSDSGSAAGDSKVTSYILRVFAPADKVNKYQILEGSDLYADNEILLNRDFAGAHGISAGDIFSIAGKEYVVSGFAVRPDYLYAQKEMTDFYLDKAAFGQVTMSRNAFKELEHTQSYYSIVYHKDNSVDVRQALFDKYSSIAYISADSNNRIGMVRDLPTQLSVMVGTIMPFMFGMIIVIVAVVIGRMVKKEQKQIGTLVAMGYRKSEMIRHYSIYAMIPGILGSLMGILLSVFFIKPFLTIFVTDYEMINYDMSFKWSALLIALFLPAALYMLTSIFTVGRLLRKNTVLLLAGNAFGDQKKKSRFLAKCRLSFRHKFQIRSLLKNKSRTFVVIMGMFVGGFVCALGFIMIDSCDYLIEKGLDAAGSYEYQYSLNTIMTDQTVEGEAMLAARFEVEGHNSLFTLSGLVKDPKYLDLKTRSGEPVKYGSYYLTSNAAALYGVKSGDTFTFINILTTEKYKVPVEDIIEDDTQCALYTSSANVAGLLKLPDNSYNVILSDKELNIDEDIVALESSKEKIKDQLKVSIELIMSFVYAMIVFGAVLCMISVYLTVNMLVEENKINISMLKVLGYRPREINRLVLNTNHILLPISFALSIFACLELCAAMFEAFISQLNLYIKPVISIPSMLICLAVLTASYWASLTMLKRKAYRVDMVESLKDNRD